MNTQSNPVDNQRYQILLKIASGGMATVYVGQLTGALGFCRLVAIKRPHQHLVEDRRFIRMLVGEATLASRIEHPNVVAVRDVVDAGNGYYLVMDLVEGAALNELLAESNRQSLPLPAPGIVLRIALDACAGLHAAHELVDDHNRPVGLVHRDVTPHNILVGVDGSARVTDFGIAKSIHVHGQSTTVGTIKGKLGYVAPEYLRSLPIDRRADVFSMGIVVWEALANRRLFQGENQSETMMNVLDGPIAPISTVANVPVEFDEVLARALDRDPEERFQNVRAFAEALDHTARHAKMTACHSQVGLWVRAVVGEKLDARRAAIHKEQRSHFSRSGIIDVEREEPRMTDPLPAAPEPPGAWGATDNLRPTVTETAAGESPSSMSLRDGVTSAQGPASRTRVNRRTWVGTAVLAAVLFAVSLAVLALAGYRVLTRPATVSSTAPAVSQQAPLTSASFSSPGSTVSSSPSAPGPSQPGAPPDRPGGKTAGPGTGRPPPPVTSPTDRPPPNPYGTVSPR